MKIITSILIFILLFITSHSIVSAVGSCYEDSSCSSWTFTHKDYSCEIGKDITGKITATCIFNRNVTESGHCQSCEEDGYTYKCTGGVGAFFETGCTAVVVQSTQNVYCDYHDEQPNANCNNLQTCSCTTSTECRNQGGTCGSPSRPGTTITGICPCGTSCVCVVPPAPTATPTPTCSPRDGADAVCGSAANQVFTSTPTANLCSTGSASSVSLTGTTFSWTCYGRNGVCGGSDGYDTSCTATYDTPPTFNNFSLKNTSDTLVTAETTNRNQICQSEFIADDTARFVITYSDPQGNAGISNIILHLTGPRDVTFTTSSYPIERLGNLATATFDVSLDDLGNVPGLYSIKTSATTLTGVAEAEKDTGRFIKFWDCQLSFSGSFYDNTTASACTFNNKINSGLPSFDFTLTDGTDSITTPVTPPDYSGNSNRLRWGKTYFTLSSAPGNLSDAQINGTCVAVNKINTKLVDPYADNPSLNLNYALTVSQSWFQASGGGVIGNQSVSNSIPATCALNSSICTPSVSINSLNSEGGVVAAFTDSNNCGLEGSNCTFGQANRNWKVKTALAKTNYRYDYFFNQYFKSLSQGVTTPTSANMSDLFSNLSLGGTGVVFVNGNLTIDANNTLPVNKYLMLIVNGDININPSVTNVSGILLANQNINVGGTGTSQLVINGSLYAPQGSINLTRSFDDIADNQTTPSILVNYRPDLIFSLPGKLVKLISGWKQGY
jgi:hypothetical protein